MRDRAPPPARIDMARVREELRERDRAADEEARLQAALAAERQIQALALAPAGGWWRHGKCGQTLKRRAVMEAISVGCAVEEIMRHSGASRAEVAAARSASRDDPDSKGATDDVRDWPAILRAAHDAGLPQIEVARAQHVTPGAVAQQQARFGIELPTKSAWTPAHDDYLRAHYGKKPMSEIESVVHRTRFGIWKRASKLGLTKTSRTQRPSKATHD